MFQGTARKAICLLTAMTIGSSLGAAQAFAADQASAIPSGALSSIASYQAGEPNKDGGVAEIVKFNSDNNQFYLVNGQSQRIDIVSLASLQSDGHTALTSEKKIDISGMIKGFVAGDVTSVDVNTEQDLIAVAVQAADYKTNGVIILLDYDGSYVAHYEAGVQPDMVTFSADGKYILSANEGEPREGYAEGTADPKGTVTIVNLAHGTDQAAVTTVDFTAYDDKRAELIADGVILKKNAPPSVDLEPEYIAVAEDGKAYFSLQEANAIATIDIAGGKVLAVNGLGFKDHGKAGNEIDIYRDGKINIKAEANTFGMYMPDGITTYSVGGKTYVVTANEGDSRSWGEYTNEKDVEIAPSGRDGKKDKAIELTTFDTSDYEGGFIEGATYLFGARSFSIWDTADMSLVYDSGSDLETISGGMLPEYFNWSNDDDVFEKRSAKKGPEPEDVKVGVIDGKTYAFVGLERIGGVMMYDITNPAAPIFEDYNNTRDFSDKIAGDVAPEGMAFVPASHSPIEAPLLLVGNEVSGTVSVMKVDDLAPANTVTRGEFVTLLAKHANADVSAFTTSSFKDVHADSWYAPYAAWASEKKITSGVGSSSFAPDEKLTREQMAAMIVRFTDTMGIPLTKITEATPPLDSDSISSYAAEAVAGLQQAGFDIVKDDNTFAPHEKLTRAEAESMIASLLKLQ